MKHAGIGASGVSLAGFQNEPDLPIGSLLMPGGSHPTSMAFYNSDAKASLAETRFRHNVARDGETMTRHGALLITWGSVPNPIEESCALYS